MEDILLEIKQERFEQDAKWGQQNHDPVSWNAILGEEIGEVAKEVVEFIFHGGDSKDSKELILGKMRMELIQSAAVIVAMIESFDRNELSK